MRFGDGWHPNNAGLGWLKRKGLPRLREIAHEQGRPVPSFCPRVRLRLTDSPLNEERRLPGEGTLWQVRSDLEALASLGAEHVLLDTFYGNPEATRHHEGSWNILATVGEKVLDLGQGRLRRTNT